MTVTPLSRQKCYYESEFFLWVCCVLNINNLINLKDLLCLFVCTVWRTFFGSPNGIETDEYSSHILPFSVRLDGSRGGDEYSRPIALHALTSS